MNYWLLKSEPSTFSFDDLKQSPKKTTKWDGVRNYQARNYLRNMQIGDQAFFYHSNCLEPGIVGIVDITGTHFADLSALDPLSPYFDPKSTIENPRWSVVEVTFTRELKTNITLKMLKEKFEYLLLIAGKESVVKEKTDAKETKNLLTMTSSMDHSLLKSCNRFAHDDLSFLDDDFFRFPLLNKGNRLSVIPVTKNQWDFILDLE